MNTLDEIESLLRDTGRRDTPELREALLQQYDVCIAVLHDNQVSADTFSNFLENIHDDVVNCDPALKPFYLRAIRFCINSKHHCEALLEQVSPIYCFINFELISIIIYYRNSIS